MSEENILYGGFEGSQEDLVGDAKSFGEYLLRKLKDAGETVLFIDGLTGEHFSGYDVRRRTIHLAKCLRNRFGIKCGDTVGISSENRIEFAIITFATLTLGATLAPLNTTYSEGEINHALNLSRPKIVFVSNANAAKIAAVSKKNQFIKEIILLDDSATAIKYGTPYTLFIGDETVLSSDEFQCEVQNMKENVSLILCSSGTTGLPKGVQLTQYNVLIGDSSQYNRPRKMEDEVAPVPIVSGILPWFHAFGINVLIINALRTSCTVYLPKFQEEAFLRCVEKYKINTAFIVPPLMVFLAKSPLVDKYDVSSLKVIWCGAAPLSKEIQDAVRARIGVPVIRQGYGMTEGTLAFTGQTDNCQKNGSVGIIRKGVQGKVVDPRTGFIFGPFTSGELCFKGPLNMKGYVGDKLATSATIDKQGWLHTGDIGYYDRDGEWFIVDRIKELIKYKGFQVPPAEIEAVLLTHPKIKDVGVIGTPDEIAGELAFAFVVLQPNSALTKDNVIQYAAERLSPPKQLHGGVIFIDEIPKNASGKILRRVLREMAKPPKSKL